MIKAFASKTWQPEFDPSHMCPLPPTILHGYNLGGTEVGKKIWSKYIEWKKIRKTIRGKKPVIENLEFEKYMAGWNIIIAMKTATVEWKLSGCINYCQSNLEIRIKSSLLLCEADSQALLFQVRLSLHPHTCACSVPSDKWEAPVMPSARHCARLCCLKMAW